MSHSDVFALIDCNNFFVSCERLFNPLLRRKPVIILSGNDGCIVSRSQEAKALGIKMGAPFFQYRSLVDQHQVIAISGNLTLYADISRRVMNTLKEFTDKVHIYSIDEAFLDIQDIDQDSIVFARKIRHTIYKKIGISVSVGIAPTKTLCKLATGVAKSNPQKYKGTVSLMGKDINSLLDCTPIQDIWGIGTKTAQKLLNKRIRTAGQFIQIPESHLKKILNSKLPIQTYYELKGVSCIPFRERTVPQSILCSRSLNKELSDFTVIKQMIADFTIQTYTKLYQAQASARSIAIILNENRFKVDQYQHSINAHFPHAHSDYQLFLHKSRELLENAYDPLRQYKQIGVVLYDIQHQNDISSSLFSGDDQKSKDIFEVIDFFHKKYNKKLIAPLSTQIQGQYFNKDFFSQRYTTHWDEILEIDI